MSLRIKNAKNKKMEHKRNSFIETSVKSSISGSKLQKKKYSSIPTTDIKSIDCITYISLIV